MNPFIFLEILFLKPPDKRCSDHFDDKLIKLITDYKNYFYQRNLGVKLFFCYA